MHDIQHNTRCPDLAPAFLHDPAGIRTGLNNVYFRFLLRQSSAADRAEFCLSGLLIEFAALAEADNGALLFAKAASGGFAVAAAHENTEQKPARQTDQQCSCRRIILQHMQLLCAGEQGDFGNRKQRSQLKHGTPPFPVICGYRSSEGGMQAPCKDEILNLQRVTKAECAVHSGGPFLRSFLILLYHSIKEKASRAPQLFCGCFFRNMKVDRMLTQAHS